jgi:antitoxin VapB
LEKGKFDSTDPPISPPADDVKKSQNRLPGYRVEWFIGDNGIMNRVEGFQMSLNIKNPETRRLAEELAKRTGESITAAVTTAIRERLDRVRREQGASLADRILEIGQDCAKRLKEPYRSVDHSELLYDERGLPR